jgi:hypothetical protein
MRLQDGWKAGVRRWRCDLQKRAAAVNGGRGVRRAPSGAELTALAPVGNSGGVKVAGGAALYRAK